MLKSGLFKLYSCTSLSTHLQNKSPNIRFALWFRPTVIESSTPHVSNDILDFISPGNPKLRLRPVLPFLWSDSHSLTHRQNTFFDTTRPPQPISTYLASIPNTSYNQSPSASPPTVRPSLSRKHIISGCLHSTPQSEPEYHRPTRRFAYYRLIRTRILIDLIGINMSTSSIPTLNQVRAVQSPGGSPGVCTVSSIFSLLSIYFPLMDKCRHQVNLSGNLINIGMVDSI